MKLISDKANRGFTLAESVIALGILVVLITGFLAVFGPAADSIRKTLSAEEASRLQDTLTRELTTLRGRREKSEFRDDSFAKAFDWISRSPAPGGSIILYKYRADPSNIRDDGTLERYKGSDGVAGRDFLIQPMARRVIDPLLEMDLEAVDGRIFYVKLTQMINEDGSWQTDGDPDDPAQAGQIGKIIDPYEGEQTDFATSPERYPEAVVVMEANFYALPTNSIQYLKTFNPTEVRRPVFTRNIAVRR